MSAPDPPLADGIPGSGANVAEYRYQVDGGPWSSVGTTQISEFSIPGAADGSTITAEITTTDLVGNHGTPVVLTTTAAEVTGSIDPGEPSGESLEGIGFSTAVRSSSHSLVTASSLTWASWRRARSFGVGVGPGGRLHLIPRRRNSGGTSSARAMVRSATSSGSRSPARSVGEAEVALAEVASGSRVPDVGGDDTGDPREPIHLGRLDRQLECGLACGEDREISTHALVGRPSLPRDTGDLPGVPVEPLEQPVDRHIQRRGEAQRFQDADPVGTPAPASRDPAPGERRGAIRPSTRSPSRICWMTPMPGMSGSERSRIKRSGALP
jgi:hypothetical protein